MLAHGRKITFEGKPVVSAKIERHVNWKEDKVEIDTAYTNENGRFSFSIKK